MDALEKYLRDMQEMFGTKGWRNTVEEAKEAIEGRKEALCSCSPDEVKFIQGEIYQLRILANLEDLVESRVAAQKE